MKTSDQVSFNYAVQQKWNHIYSNSELIKKPLPAQVLVDFSHLLPKTGRALDLACGRGGNAIFLANAGLNVWAWDISDVALDQLSAQAEQTGLQINTEVRDIESECFPVDCFDVIIIGQFLNRSICTHILDMLVSGGLLFYQTFTVDALTMGIGPKNPDYLLQRNELLTLFDGMQLHGYREDDASNFQQGEMLAQAYLVARKVHKDNND